MTLLGPLTTAFQVPATCTAVATQLYLVRNGTQSSLVQGPLFSNDPSCFPTDYEPAPTNYYSPAFCPAGYTSACSSLETAKSETAVACCPDGLRYTCGTNQQNQVSLGCTTTWQGAAAVFTATVLSDKSTGSTTVLSQATGGISAYGIYVRFREGDPTAVSTSRPSVPPATSLPPVVLMPTDTGKKSSGLSSTAKIGIGVGAGLAFFIAMTSLWFFIYTRRRRRQRGAEAIYGPEPKLPRSDGPPPVPPKELSPTPVSYRAIPPPMYELSEEVSPRLPRSMASKRHRSSSPNSGMSSPVGTFESGVMYGVGVVVPLPPSPPVELEADVPSESSMRERAASPASSNTAWSDNRQARNPATTASWI